MLPPLELELDSALAKLVGKPLLPRRVLHQLGRHVLHAGRVQFLRLPPSQPRVHLRREQPLLQFGHLAHGGGSLGGGDARLRAGVRGFLEFPPDLRRLSPGTHELELQTLQRGGELAFERGGARGGGRRRLVNFLRDFGDVLRPRRLLLRPRLLHRRLDWRRHPK